MIALVSDIMTTEICTVDAYEGLCKAERLIDEKDIDCLPVIKDGNLAGILTLDNIRKAHPNRIVADAMTKSIISVTPNTSLWKAKKVFEENKIHTLLVLEDGIPVGLLTKACLYAELGKHIDLLTGLYRSDYIYHMGAELLENGIEISIVFIDLDKFGQIDKEYGHAKGDEILTEVSMLLKKHTFGDTYLCRFGGDEFAILTPYNLDKSKVLAEILIIAITTHKFTDNIKVTVSAGIAGGRRQDERAYDFEEMLSNLINLASLASTRAKKEKIKLAVAEELFLEEVACSGV